MNPVLIQKAAQLVASNAKYVKDLKVKRAFDMATKWASNDMLKNVVNFIKDPKNPRRLIRK